MQLRAALITATWQAPTVPSIPSHTSLKSIQLACVWECVRAFHHHSASPEYRQAWDMTHLAFLGGRETRWLEENWYQILCSKTIANVKVRLACWFFCFTYLFIFWLSVISCCSFYVALSVCPRDDNFSDTLSQKADSEASSGHAGEDKCSGKDMGSPADTRISEAYISRLVFILLYSCGIQDCNIKASSIRALN